MNKSSLDTDVLVIGAGIIGLAVARAISLKGKSVILVEKNSSAGTEISSRNSEVIHAGLYYPSNSLKTKFCIEGKNRLYSYCKKYNIPFNNCGKLIVATSKNERNKLEEINQNAKKIGLNDVYFLTKKQLNNIEPELKCTEALFSGSSGIVDSHALIQSFVANLQNLNCTVAFNSNVSRIIPEKKSLLTEVIGNNESIQIRSLSVVNCGGLSSQIIARKTLGLDIKFIPMQYLAKGTYFTLNKKAPFNHLIYPVPEKQGLGIHFTLDLSGKAKFGPDLEWITKEDYTTDINQRKKFFDQIRKFWPEIKEEELVPDYAGIRPKISGPDEEASDFIIQFPKENKIAGLINLFGIESPGLTSCLSIASEISSRLNEVL
ncbi:MAG: FAD-dependent oxidoreductase [Rhodospirillaceae bacterium]|nr:FAD-dependent oxidoreductase [Rhodospirillaceae bacterium]